MSYWKTKILSTIGGEILLKAILHALPTYTMSIFMLPKAITSRLNGYYSEFWWGYSDNSTKIQWIDWDKLGVPNALGGLGFSVVQDFNLALLAKQCWRFFTAPSSYVSRLFKQKYYPKSDFLQAKLSQCPSYAWRSLLVGRQLLKASLIWRIGNGNRVKVWKHQWLPRPMSYNIQSPIKFLREDAYVVELIDKTNSCWKTNLL